MQNDLHRFRPENISEKVVLLHRWGTWASLRVILPISLPRVFSLLVGFSLRERAVVIQDAVDQALREKRAGRQRGSLQRAAHLLRRRTATGANRQRCYQRYRSHQINPLLDRATRKRSARRVDISFPPVASIPLAGTF